ncbi:TetR/AcrR family transcriptional regulator [Mangrovicella endophytica]|uniref:TetR/AcrR family transcriptional regulator n=1 Tax=Mangrovicella endophytica TaxID=2066697 RepID=UPI000C9E50CD|nr:TetR family transcriptional regulator [Mangrovicella endophytica]
MPESSDIRSRKRRAMRRAISQVADRLFLERGFDNVTVDEIAAAADVGRMTVFNYFPRKEDMFFDRDEEGREAVREAIRQRDLSVSPIETLRLLLHRLIAEQAPYLEFSGRSQDFVKTVERSETLKARARAIRDELTQAVAESLAECLGNDPADSDARLAAAMLIATWSTAFLEAHRVFQQRQDCEAAKAVFLAIADKGALGVQAAMVDTPYTKP